MTTEPEPIHLWEAHHCRWGLVDPDSVDFDEIGLRFVHSFVEELAATCCGIDLSHKPSDEDLFLVFDPVDGVHRLADEGVLMPERFILHHQPGDRPEALGTFSENRPEL